MPTPAMAADLMLNASIPGLEQKIAEATGAGFSTGLDGEMKTEMQKLTKSMYAARRDAIKLGRKKEADALKETHARRLASVKALYRTQQALENDLRNEENAEAKKAKQAALAHTMTMIAKNQQALKDEIRKRSGADAARLKLMQDGLERAARTFGSKMDEGLTGFADKFENALQQAMSVENLDLGAMLKGGGSSLKGAAPDLMAGGSKLAEFGAKRGGALGGAAAGLGKAAVALGAAAGVIAGVAAVVAGFVAVMMAAYGQTKEFNKAILEGSSAVDMLGSEALGSAGALSAELGELRKGAQGVAADFRSSSEEVLALATAMNQSGFTYREQTKVFGDYGAAMRQAQITTQAFGVGAGEYAESVNQMTRDFAYGQQAIAEGFQDIFGAAQMSGMGVKNFFTAISETTSGMALYNFKLEDTLELMLGLEKLLGKDLSREVMGSLKGKYRGASTQERTKASMTAGSAGRQVLQTFMLSAEQGFKTALGDASADSQRAVANRGGVEGMRTMSSRDLAALANEIQAAGDEALARKVLGLGRAQRGGARGAGLGARSEALGELDQAGTMAFSMSQAYGLLGDTALTDMSGTTKMAFEEITGLSGEMLTAYQDVFARAEARAAEQGGATDFKSVIEGIQTGDLLSAEDKAALAEAQESASVTMESIAQQQLKETQSILQTLKTGVVMMLETIYDGMTYFLPGSGTEIKESRQKRDAAQKALDEFEETGNTEADKIAQDGLKNRLTFEQSMYEGTLQGESRNDVYRGLRSGFEMDELSRAGLTTKMTVPSASSNEFSGRSGSFYADTGTDTFEAVVGEQSLTNEQLGGLYKLTKDATVKAKTASEKETRATNVVSQKVQGLHDLLEAQGLSKLAETLYGDEDNPFTGDINDAEAIKNFLKKDGLTGQEEAMAAAAGVSFDDFIYRGDGSGSGTINPINKADDFYGAKPGGAIAKALGGGGGGMVINKIIIYESGDPQKTLAMIKQGVDAAMRKA